MDDGKKPLIYMIVFGIVRAFLAWASGYAAGHNWIDPTTHTRLLSEGAATTATWILAAVPVIWTVLQKTQVWGWVKTALQLDPRRTSPGDVPSVAPGPSTPL